jgi:hypothetical protein
MQGLKKMWMNYVKQQTERTARDPNAKTKLVGWIIVLLIIGYNVPKADTSFIGCGPCMAWAAPFCAKAVAAGGACATVAGFPLLSAPASY